MTGTYLFHCKYESSMFGVVKDLLAIVKGLLANGQGYVTQYP